MDIRLLDVFTATPYIEPVLTTADAQRQTKSALNAMLDKNQRIASMRRNLTQNQRRTNTGRRSNGTNSYGQSQYGTLDTQTTTPTVFSYGKLNINTCIKSALLGISGTGSMTGMNSTAATPVAFSNDTIEKFEAYRLQQIGQNKVPFTNLSDFFVKFMPNLSRSNMGQVETLSRLLTVGSSSFEISSQNRLSEKDQAALNDKSGRSGRRPAVATANWVVATDKQPYQVVSFTMVP
jgi:hypothetical protein